MADIQKNTNAPSASNVPGEANVSGAVPGVANAQTPVAKIKTPTNWKKLLMIIGSALFGLVLIVSVAAYFIFNGIDPTEDVSGKAGFLNAVVLIVYGAFALLALFVFGILMNFLVKMLLAKKEEVEKKSKAKKRLILTGIGLVVVLGLWLTGLIYFEGKRSDLNLNATYAPIMTEPADILQLSAPITIKFNATYAPIDSENYQVLSYEWDFGDKETGSGVIATHEYKKKGKFDVILTITKMNRMTGVEVKDKYSVIVTVTGQNLTADIVADPAEGAVPLKVKFDASNSVDPESKIINYEWDVDGDSEIDEEFTGKDKIEYEYTKVGTYEVTLQISSLNGNRGTTTKQIVVKASDAPEAKIEVQDTPAKFEKGVSYIFKGGSSVSQNGAIISYEWNFGDGSPIESAKTVNHKFTKEGEYKVALTVTDEEGKTGETIMDILVGAKPGVPEAHITTSPALAEGSLVLEGAGPFLVEFDASSTKDSDNNVVEYNWDFDSDGKDDAFGKTAKNLFTKEGVYKVTLTVKDAKDNTSQASVGIKVTTPGLSAVLTASPLSGEVPLIVNFDASGSYYPKGTISSYKWNFGDATDEVLGAAKISHKYTQVGQYTATVTVIGTDNSQSKQSVNVVIRAIQLSACFKANPSSGQAPLTVSFDPDCTVGPVSSYSWKFGDGGTSNEVKPTHEYSNPGLYTVELEVLDNNNTVSTSTTQVEVQQ